MIVSLAWLKKYVDVPVDTQTLARDLTMLGLNVEHVTAAAVIDPAVVVGRVLSAERHPDADRLSVCSVDVGDGTPLEIVCGAPNVAAGQLVPVALPGATLAGGLKIRRSKIRGVVSNGMICSEIELGLGDDASGIIVIDRDAAPGTQYADVAAGGDDVLEIEVTPNRPDQLCHVGVAREVAALYATALHLPAPSPGTPKGGSPAFSVSIADPGDCYRFTGRVIRGVTVGPSPAWLRSALEGLGLKSINNVVDVSNYVMMEMGQPTHAYDLDSLPHRRMGVRRARADETIVALDEVEYRLRDHQLLIVDDDEPVGVAGVIGGMATRVTDGTQNLLIESAAFNPRVVRATRKTMNISTDASYRFERGSDRTACARASERVAELILEVAGGTAGEFIDAYPAPWTARRVSVRRSNTRRLLGVTLGVDEIARLLSRLHFDVVETDDDRVTVEVPSFRDDIIEETDLVEEVARLNGYDKIGHGWSFRTTTVGAPDPFDGFVESLADHLVARGYTELVTSSFCEGGEAGRFGWDPGDRRSRAVGVVNPLSARHSFMRTSLLPGALEALRWNIDRGVRSINAFVVGRVFHRAEGEQGLPEEPLQLLIVRTRPAGTEFWSDRGSAPDLFEIKAEVEVLASRNRVDLGARFAYEFEPRTGAFRYVDQRNAVVEGGIVPPRVSDHYDFEQPVWYAVADLRDLYEARSRRTGFKQVPEYPASKRDLSLVTPPGVSYAQIEKSLVKHGGRLLESAQVFDVYSGGNLPAGNTAYGVRLCFRSAEGTLRDADVDAVVTKVVNKLQSELGVVLRS